MTSEDDSKTVAIRPAKRDDLPWIERFIRPLVDQHKLLPRTTDELDELIRHAFIAEAGEEPVGFAALEIYSEKLAEVRSLAVAPAWQKRGIGRRLVEACVQRAQEENILEVMAITSSESFFKACGFDFTLPGEKKALFLQVRDGDQTG